MVTRRFRVQMEMQLSSLFDYLSRVILHFRTQTT